MASTYQDQPYTPIGGVNGTDNEAALNPGEVADSRNLIFERGQMFTRPGLTDFPSMTGKTVIYAKGFEGSFFTMMFICSDNTVYRRFIDGTIELVPITGTVNFGLEQYHNMNIVNGALMIGNNPTGIIRVIPTSLTTCVGTVLTDAPYVYVTGHYSRAFAAVQLGVDNLKVAWSVPGDESTWVAPPNTINGSGVASLSDAPDFITKLSVINNVVVIYRNGGLHLAYANQSNNPAYNFQTWTRSRMGLTHPSSLASANNLDFFVSQHDVKIFDLNQLKSIGWPIRKKLIPFIDAGVPIFGFVTVQGLHDDAYTSKFRYHLIPLPYYGSTMFINIDNTVANCDTIHFIYSVEDGNWSIHDYNFRPTAVMEWQGDPVGLNDSYGKGPCLIEGTSGECHIWDDAKSPEKRAYMLGRQFTVGRPEQDWVLQRTLLRTRDYGASTVTVSATARLNNTVVTRAKSDSIGFNNDHYWVRSWFDMLASGNTGSGQNWQPLLTLPAGKKFALDYINMRFTPAGEFRG